MQACIHMHIHAGTDTSEALEQLSWLQRMAAHCLADSGSGEVPMMPQALAEVRTHKHTHTHTRTHAR